MVSAEDVGVDCFAEESECPRSRANPESIEIREIHGYDNPAGERNKSQRVDVNDGAGCSISH